MNKLPDLPNVRFGSRDTLLEGPLPPLLDDSDDDELEGPTDPAVVKMLGFDPQDPAEGLDKPVAP